MVSENLNFYKRTVFSIGGGNGGGNLRSNGNEISEIDRFEIPSIISVKWLVTLLKISSRVKLYPSIFTILARRFYREEGG